MTTTLRPLAAVPKPRRRTIPHGRTCPNQPRCPHGLMLHDIPEPGPRREVCTVADCTCGAT